MISNYTSIKSILYDLSLTVDERYWNEIKMTEWAHRALRMIHTDQSLESKVTYIEVCTHKAVLPSNLKYLTQIVYLDNTIVSDIASLDLPPSSDLAEKLNQESYIGWKPMRLTSNPFHASICLDKKISMCTDCVHEFGVSTDLVLTTTLENGIIMVSYLAWPMDDDGYALIPDNEYLKEAIFHYILYRYWLAKQIMNEPSAANQVQFHLRMWGLLKAQAASTLNRPDVNELENLHGQLNRMLPRSSRFQQLFLTLGNRERLNY